MADNNRRHPIDRLRDAAASLRIGDESDGGISEMISFDKRLLTLTTQSTFEVFLADQIDPGRTNPDVPNAHERILDHGTESEIVGKTILLSDQLLKSGFVAGHVDRDVVMPIMLELAKILAGINGRIANYSTMCEAAIAKIPEASEDIRNRNSFAVPKVAGAENICQDIFLEAKRALQKQIDLACVFFPDFPRGYFPKLREYLIKRYGDGDEFAAYVGGIEHHCKFIVETRNAIEHPRPNYQVILRNVRLNENAEVELPTFELIHDELAQPETRLDHLFPLLLEGLLSTSEDFFAWLVCKNTEMTFAGSEIEMLWHENGFRGYPHLRYSYGIRINGELRPIG